jgi:GntR family transcriptional regulator
LAAGESAQPDPIDRHSPVPYYLQLRAILQDLIERGGLRAGDPLPSETELGVTYGLSRTVIRSALDLLEHEGRVRRAKGKRTVVSRRIPWDFQLVQTGAYRDFAEPYRIRAVLYEAVQPADRATMQALDLVDARPVLNVHALYEAPEPSKSAAALMRLQVVTDASPTIQRIVDAGKLPEFEVGGASLLMQLIERYKVELAYSLTTVAPVTCPRKDARLLGIRDRSVVLRVSAVGHDPRSRPILAFQATPHTDHARLRFVVRY